MEPQVCAKCLWTMDRQLNNDGIKILNKKRTTGSIKPFDEGEQVVIHAVHIRLPT